MNYAVEQRMRFIDFMLDHVGYVNRAMLTDYYGIGEATASRDFKTYRELTPGNMAMNESTKCWVKTESFVRVYPAQ